LEDFELKVKLRSDKALTNRHNERSARNPSTRLSAELFAKVRHVDTEWTQSWDRWKDQAWHFQQVLVASTHLTKDMINQRKINTDE
jgi:hypothetical protein